MSVVCMYLDGVLGGWGLPGEIQISHHATDAFGECTELISRARLALKSLACKTSMECGPCLAI